MLCSNCKHELRIGKSETVQRDGKTIRVMRMVCMTKGCPLKGQTQETVEKEITGNE